MSSLKVSACSLSLILAAVAGQAPCGAGVLIEKEMISSALLNTLDVFGLQHTAVGNAQLSMSPTGTLVVSNIGSSGLDGVTMPIGDVRGFSMSMDIGDMGALAPGGLVEVCYPYSFGDQTIFVQAQQDGSARIGTGVCGGAGGGGVQAMCVSVEILDDGVVVGARDYVCGETDYFVSGDFGTDPITGETASFSFEQRGADYVATVSLPISTLLTLPPTVVNLGDEAAGGNSVRMIFSGLPPAETLSGPVRVTAANVGGSIEITGHELNVPGNVYRAAADGELPIWVWYPVATGVRTTGGALFTGTPEADFCKVEPEYWMNVRDTAAPPRAITVSNIGSSGLDGVSIDYSDVHNGCATGERMCPDGSCASAGQACPDPLVVSRFVAIADPNAPQASPDWLDLDDDGDTVLLRAHGDSGNNLNWDFGGSSLANVAGQLQLTADFTPIGSDLVRVEVYDAGVFVGEYETFNQPGVPLGEVQVGPGGLDLNGCGKLGGDLFGPPCFVWRFENPVTFQSPIGGFAGDEIRVLAAAATSSVDFIQTLEIAGIGLEPFMVYDLPEKETTLAMGLKSAAEGDAVVTKNASGHLAVDNLGSSGCDGVSIAFGGDTEIVAMQLISGGDFIIDSFFDVSYTVFDEQCPTCPGQVVSSVRVQATAPDQGVISGTNSDAAALLSVTLRDAAGNTVGAFPMDQTQFISIKSVEGGTLGGPVRHGFIRLATTKSPGVGAPPSTDTAFVLDFDVGNGSDSLIAMSPAGISYPGVVSVEIGSTNASASSNPTRVQTRLLRLTASSAFVVGDLRVGVDGSLAEAQGQARLATFACEHETGVPGARLSVSNIGSSGLDGVRFDLAEGVCNGLDDNCDGEVDETASVFRMTIEGLNPVQPGGDIVVSMNKVDMVDDAELLEIGSAVRNIGAAPMTSEFEVRYFVAGVPEPFQLDVVVRDAAGNTIASENGDLLPDILGPSTAAIRPRKRKLSVETLIRAGTSPTGTTTLEGLTQVYSWGEDLEITLVRTGQLVPGARSLEFNLRLRSFPALDAKDKGVVSMQSSAGTSGSYVISEVVLDNPPPPCPADTNGDGVIDNGDIGVFITLFLAQDPAVDFTGDGVVDNGDIGAFIVAFLAGC